MKTYKAIISVNLFTLFFLLLIALHGLAQVPYSKIYDVKNYDNCFAVSPGGNAVFCGRTFSDGIATMVRVNSSGDILFAKRFSDAWAIFQVLQLEEESSLIALSWSSDTCNILKVDSNGTVLWSKAYYANGSPGFSGKKILQTSTHTFIVASGTVYFEIDETGNLLWARQINDGGYFLSVAESSSGYLFSRSYYDGDVYNFEIIQTDFAGAITWVNNQWLHLGYNYLIDRAEVVEAGGNIYACMGVLYKYSNQDPEGVGGMLQKFDLNGNRLSSIAFFPMSSAFTHTVYDCKYLENGRFLVSLLLEFAYPETPDAYIIEIDTSGTIEWCRVYADSAINSLEVDSDHNIYCLMNEPYYSSGYDLSVTLKKITSNGESTCPMSALPADTVENYYLFPSHDPIWSPQTKHLNMKDVEVGLEPLIIKVADECEETGITVTGAIVAPSIFPNPADRFLELSLPQYFKTIKYEIYNLAGNVIFSSEKSPCVVSGRYHIALPSYQEGMYALKISCDDHVFTEKFVVVH